MENDHENPLKGPPLPVCWSGPRGRDRGPAHADLIIGGSTLITPAGFTQLESWLGQGDITLTKVFSHTLGDGQTSYNFHAAVDGLGATFTVIQLLATQGNQAQVIGGYNPQSWNSTNSYNITPTDAARTAFLFDLTNVAIQSRNSVRRRRCISGTPDLQRRLLRPDVRRGP